MREKGYSMKEIATKLPISYQTLNKFLWRYDQTGIIEKPHYNNENRE